MTEPGKNKPPSLAQSFAYAFEGLREALRQGRNIRIQMGAAVLAVVLGFALRIDALEWVLVIFCIGGVLGAECFNTSFEDVVDLACSDVHPKAKAAKDLAAAGVLAFSAASLVIGVIIFLPRIMNLLGW
jgi:undecaprenol kinase